MKPRVYFSVSDFFCSNMFYDFLTTFLHLSIDLFITVKYSIVWPQHNLFIHSTAVGHLGYFQLGPLMNCADKKLLYFFAYLSVNVCTHYCWLCPLRSGGWTAQQLTAQLLQSSPRSSPGQMHMGMPLSSPSPSVASSASGIFRLLHFSHLDGYIVGHFLNVK